MADFPHILDTPAGGNNEIVIATSTTPFTVTNDTTLTQMGSATIPAQYMVSGLVIFIDALYRYTNSVGGNKIMRVFLETFNDNNQLSANLSDASLKSTAFRRVLYLDPDLTTIKQLWRSSISGLEQQSLDTDITITASQDLDIYFGGQMAVADPSASITLEGWAVSIKTS